MVLFNNGQGPKKLTKFKLNDLIINLKQYVTFLGVILTTELNWKKHIDSVLSKARKSLNFLKIVCRHHWGQDTSTRIRLPTSLVRSELTYGQEVEFSASKCFHTKIIKKSIQF